MGFASSVAATADSIGTLHREYLHPMTPGRMISELLDASFHPDVQAPRITEIIESNPLYAHYLQKLDILQEKVVEWRQETPDDPSTERLTRFITALLGPAAIRNTVLAIWLMRNAAQGLPKKKDVPLVVIPKTYLRYSMAMAEYCEDQQIANGELAYFGALCFDWVSMLLEKKGGTAKSEKAYLEELWPKAIKAGRLAYELAALPEQMVLSGMAFPAVLLVHLGKVLMAASFPKGGSEMGWKEFLKHCESHGKSSDLGHRILEKNRFPWTHSEAAALCSLVFTQIKSAERGIRYYLEPELLKGSEPESHELALIVSTAITAAKAGKASLSPKEKAELNRIGITAEAFGIAYDRVFRKK